MATANRSPQPYSDYHLFMTSCVPDIVFDALQMLSNLNGKMKVQGKGYAHFADEEAEAHQG